MSSVDTPLELTAGVYEDFLIEMDELGLLDNLEDELPRGFTAVYEIGRILADPTSDTGQAVANVLQLAAPTGESTEAVPTDSDATMIEVPAGEEYEAEFIRSWSDVRYVYADQWLLPEEVFLRRLANRTLVFPMAKAPRIRAIDTGDDDFQPSPSKQKVYVLLDTSRSMALRHRFALAKAAVLRFLKRNRSEMGEVFFRTFDVGVGPLSTALDRSSYGTLIRSISRQATLGNGTCLERAILQACSDIADQPSLSGAEILVVTDGAARMDESKVANALGDRIRLHCLKIGRAQVFATDQYVRDTLEHHTRTDTRRGQRIVQLRDRRDVLRDGIKHSHDAETLNTLRAEMRRVEAEQKEIGGELRQDFGHEIERLSHVFIEIDDLDPATAFHLTDKQLEALKELTRRLLEQLEASPAPPEAMKQAALLMAHLALLAGEQSEQASREFLEQLRTALEMKMEQAMESHEEHLLDGGLLSPGDQRDLRVLLTGGSRRGSSLWVILLRYFYRTFARVVRRR